MPEALEIPEKQIVVDEERVEQVLGRLMCAYYEEEFPYSLDTTRVPQDPRHMPETMELGTRDHAMFLWSVCYYMRGGIKSNDAVQRLATVYDDSPEFFDADVAKDLRPESIAVALRGAGLGFQDTLSKIWVENARRMQDRWDGDPRKIFAGVDNYEECLVRIQNDQKGEGFIGFQEKMVSMISYFLMDAKLIEFFQFPLPVDIHVLRVTIANELVKFPGYGEDENVLSKELLNTMRSLYFKYAVDHEISTLELCDAVWLLSQSICGKNPGNITLEPEGRKNRNGRNTVLVPLPVDTNNPNQIRLANNSCVLCPVQETCKWNVPGKVYYVQGEMRRRGERVKFPVVFQDKLFHKI